MELPFDEDSGIQTARMFCDITRPDGDPLFADPREVLRRQLNAARNMGFEFAASRRSTCATPTRSPWQTTLSPSATS